MTNKNKQIAIVGLIAALYAVITLALGFISYGQIQFRISEILMFLPLFGKEYIIALTLGCFLANVVGPFGVPDIIFGTLATLISSILVYYTPKLIKNNKYTLFIASLWPTIINALIIGWELYKFFGVPFVLGFLQVGFGEFVVITIVGLPVFKMVNNKYGNRIKNLK
ncbi:QueT transporter family protein [Terrisporobacter petrolearius]|uniref:QueT transporter family protein n=1 Tax=Terrisporobacter petrolearius TaxID=1460447 RepID=UPI001D16B1F0|nr:QueT transporter family protein [Terrisporobacter petrolearius]MCC3862985.1 QueT transporter family protein [Terrisporobacter petrolearius]